MDKSRNHEELKRIGAESREMNVASHASCEESAEHVRLSRSAISRSFELLARPFARLWD
jgi:hypothetical protein